MRTVLNASLHFVIVLDNRETFVMFHPMLHTRNRIKVTGAIVHPNRVYITAHRYGLYQARSGFTITHQDALKAEFPDSFKAVLHAAMLELQNAMAYVKNAQVVPEENYGSDPASPDGGHADRHDDPPTVVAAGDAAGAAAGAAPATEHVAP